MAGSLLASFAAPGIAAMAVGFSAILATGSGVEDRTPAFGEALTKYEADAASADAATLFDRADIDKDGALSSDEYTALAIVTAELSRLNGYVSFGDDVNVKTVSLPIEGPGALTGQERTRVEAVARNQFYVAAGSDNKISKNEFIAEKLERFESADRNRNGALTKGELVAFAAGEARLSLSKA